MRLCISSVLTASVLVTVMIALMYPFMKSRRFIRTAGTGWVMLFLICVLLRMFLPVEFFYTHTIRFSGFLTSIRKILIHNVVSNNETSVCIYHICLVVWTVGICVSACMKCRAYLKIRRDVLRYSEKPTEEVNEFIAELAQRYPELGRVELVYYPFIGSPILMGIRKPKIVLPEKGFTKRELGYILAHEVMHIRKHDTFWKLLIDILCTVYWWNPAFYFLKNEIFDIIEIQNDLRLTKEMTLSEKEEYLRCLRSVATLSAAYGGAGVVAFSYKPGKELKRRFEMVLRGASDNKLAKHAACLLVGVLAFVSSCVIFEPEFAVPENVIGVTAGNTYIVEEEDTYKVYIDGEYWFCVDSPEYLPEEMIKQEREHN